eukprot:COSAG02_NODE_1655_length_11483_cov_3.754327_9_plen_46_part_00
MVAAEAMAEARRKQSYITNSNSCILVTLLSGRSGLFCTVAEVLAA